MQVFRHRVGRRCVDAQGFELLLHRSQLGAVCHSVTKAQFVIDDVANLVRGCLPVAGPAVTSDLLLLIGIAEHTLWRVHALTNWTDFAKLVHDVADAREGAFFVGLVLHGRCRRGSGCRAVAFDAVILIAPLLAPPAFAALLQGRAGDLGVGVAFV